ncbi:unnamed protein product [Rotaria socialis]
MMLKKSFANTSRVPDDIFSYQNEQFYDFIKKLIGDKQVNLLAFQEISNADIYLHCCNVLNILKLDSSALIPYKESLCLKLDDNNYTVLPGIKSSFSYLTELLTKKKDEMIRTARQGRSCQTLSTCSATNIHDTNNSTTASNSFSACSDSICSQSRIASMDVSTFSDSHTKRIVFMINEWIEKNKKKEFNADFVLVQGIDYNADFVLVQGIDYNADFVLVQGIDYNVTVSVNPDKAFIRCACGVKATLKCSTIIVTSRQKNPSPLKENVQV